MAKFPHLLPVDAALWQQFLEQYGGAYNQFEYDVRVGAGRDPGAAYPPNIRFDAIILSQRRIDVVGYQAKLITLFEVTASAGLTALGQMIAYPHLFIETHSPDRPVKPHLVTYAFQADIEKLYIANGIDYTIIQPRTPVTITEAEA
jgi:hypothetical protein